MVERLIYTLAAATLGVTTGLGVILLAAKMTERPEPENTWVCVGMDGSYYTASAWEVSRDHWMLKAKGYVEGVESNVSIPRFSLQGCVEVPSGS